MSRERHAVAPNRYIMPNEVAVLAHRGRTNGDAGNSLKAFMAAVEAGATHIETDVRTTFEGVPVIAHDAIRSVTQHRLRSRKIVPQIDRIDPVLKLETVLTSFPRMRFSLDLKDGRSVHAVVTLIQEVDAWDRVCITSFSSRRIARARREAPPNAYFGFGVAGGVGFAIGSFLRDLIPMPRRQQPLRVLQPPWVLMRNELIAKHLVRSAHRCRIAVHPWTINSTTDIVAALRLGVDGVITDDPVRALKLLGR